MTNLIWVDLETTALETQQGQILELGLAMTTPELEIVDSRQWVVAFEKGNLPRVEDWPLKQHFLSGLLPLAMSSDNSELDVESDALHTLNRWTSWVPGQYAMCGSTVHFDRQWLKIYMPLLESWFHYRNIDVSTIKNLARLWAPDLANFKSVGLHRVKGDIEDSINELRYYVEQGIIVGPHSPTQLFMESAA